MREGRLWSTGTKKEKRVSFQRFPLYSLCPSGWGLAGDTKLCTDFVNIIQSPGEQKNRYRLEAMFWRSSSWWWWSGGKHLSWVWCVCCMLAVHCLGSSQSVLGPKIWFEFYLVSTDNTWPGCHLVCCPPQAHVLSMDQTNQGVVMHVLSGQSGELSPMAIFITVMHNEIVSQSNSYPYSIISMIKNFMAT